jgi:hypothetical protein
MEKEPCIKGHAAFGSVQGEAAPFRYALSESKERR